MKKKHSEVGFNGVGLVTAFARQALPRQRGVIMIIVDIMMSTEMQKVIKKSRDTFLAKKIAPNNGPKMTQNSPKITQNFPKWPKNDPKFSKMAQKLAPAKKNSRDISPVSPTYCISGHPSLQHQAILSHGTENQHAIQTLAML